VLHFEGDKDLPLPPAELWLKVSDTAWMVQCIPGLEAVKTVEPTKAVCTIRPAGLAFMRGSVELTMTVAETVPEKFGRMVLLSKGIGSSSAVETTFTLTPQEGGTRLHWTADVKELGGLLKAVPQGLIKGAAEKVVTDIWEAVEQRLKEEDRG
jgi:carbon monoxide dehydrogenase subunit G